MPSRGEPGAIVVVRDLDGKLRDLSWAPDADVEVTPVGADTEEGRSVIRHSTAHVLAQAVCDLWPGAKYAIGPPIENGFYYDFELPDGKTFSDDDLVAIESRMAEIIKADQPFVRGGGEELCGGGEARPSRDPAPLRL